MTSRLDIQTQTLTGQRDRARTIADELAQALRRCADDSKDLAAGRSAEKLWVAANITKAEAALDLHEARDWQ